MPTIGQYDMILSLLSLLLFLAGCIALPMSAAVAAVKLETPSRMVAPGVLAAVVAAVVSTFCCWTFARALELQGGSPLLAFWYACFVWSLVFGGTVAAWIGTVVLLVVRSPKQGGTSISKEVGRPSSGLGIPS